MPSDAWGTVASDRIGGRVVRVNFEVAAAGFESLFVDDMGEGVFVLSQLNDAGKIERVSVSLSQIAAAMDATASRYGNEKNTDRSATLVAA